MYVTKEEETCLDFDTYRVGVLAQHVMNKAYKDKYQIFACPPVTNQICTNFHRTKMSMYKDNMYETSPRP